MKKINTEESYSVFQVVGNFDGLASDELMSAIELQVASGKVFILVDFEHVDYISSMAIGTLISLYKDIKEKNGHLILFGIHDVIREIFDRTQLSKRLTICDTRDDALKFLQARTT